MASYEQVAFATGLVIGIIVGILSALVAQLARVVDREQRANTARGRRHIAPGRTHNSGGHLPGSRLLPAKDSDQLSALPSAALRMRCRDLEVPHTSQQRTSTTQPPSPQWP